MKRNAVTMPDGEFTDDKADKAAIEQTSVDAIYDLARQQALEWRRIFANERVSYLRNLRILITQKRDDIAKVISESTGKPVTESLASEVLVVLESLRHLETHARKTLQNQRIKTPITLLGKHSYVTYQPRGVVLVISPWNFPFQLSMVPVIEALAAGNSVILKPSEVTPQVGHLIQELFKAAGTPDGLVQVVQGDREAGARLVDAGPNYIHFTGSVRAGRQIQMAAAKQLIPTTLELGGKDPMVVFDDANLQRAVQGAVWGGYSNSGQVCMSVERVYVQRIIYDAFVQILAAEVAKIKQGSGQVDEVDVGLMTIGVQVETVKRHVQNALEGGARLVYGHHPETWAEHSMMVRPMVLADVHHQMDIMREETFGPVLPIVSFDTEEEAIALANDTRFGLGASVWTSDLRRGRRVVSRLMTGNACINDVIINIANPHLPYGGIKEGGIGRYHGEEGLRAFSVQTSVVVSSGRKTREVNWFPYAGKRHAFSQLIANWYGERRNVLGFFKAYMKLLRQSRDHR
jgi:acyl-CoA reductase-like NAD-dependent aldehyde dehydrogenase